jgi:hypothetical protein
MRLCLLRVAAGLQQEGKQAAAGGAAVDEQDLARVVGEGVSNELEEWIVM